jgi:hypothetical protein
MKKIKQYIVLTGLCSVLSVTACNSDDVQYVYPKKMGNGTYSHDGSEPDRLFGKDGLTLFGKSDNKQEQGIGVNSYLWRGTLDTLSFMPLMSADPFGGVIITDWYTVPDNKNERFKVNALILSTSLRADGVKVTIFKQKKENGQWIDVAVPEKAAADMEDAILVKARQLRVAATQKKS